MSDVFCSMSVLRGLRGSAPERGSDAELGALLVHQLEAPLLFALGGAAGDLEPRFGGSADVASFGELFESADPPRDLLELAKRCAKDAMRDPRRGLPREVAQALYYLAIAVANRNGYRISALSDAELLEGIGWCLRHAWVRGRARSWLEASKRLLS